MAKEKFALPSKQEAYPYPSRFGSHSSMIVEGDDPQNEHVMCHDEFGDYVTMRNRLDDGCADPLRYKESRLGKLFHGGSK